MTPIRASDLLPAIRAIGMDKVARLGDDELAQAIEDALTADDWCEDDGAGYCGNHNQMVTYYVTNFGPEGRVIWPDDPQADTIFAVCSGAYRYTSRREAEAAELAVADRVERSKA